MLRQLSPCTDSSSKGASVHFYSSRHFQETRAMRWSSR